MINQYQNQIRIIYKANTSCKSEKNPFGQNISTITADNQSLNTILNEYFTTFFRPKLHYGIFIDPLFETGYEKVSVIFQQTLETDPLTKFTLSRKIAKDIYQIEDQSEIIKFAHETKTGHRGIEATHQKIKEKSYWPGMQTYIQKFINQCPICLQCKYERNTPQIKFQLTPTPARPFEQIHIDSLYLDKSKFMTIIDAFSKFAQGYLLPNLTAVSVGANLYEFLSNHGKPVRITCDTGSEFNNQIVKDFCHLHQIELHYTTPANSNSNSVERLHSTLIETVRSLRTEFPNLPLSTLVKRALMSYNHTAHSSRKFTPMQIIRANTNIINPYDDETDIIYSDFIRMQQQINQSINSNVKENLQAEKQRRTDKLNISRTDPIERTPGETVFMRTTDHRKTTPLYKKDEVKDQSGPIIQGKRLKRHVSKVKPKRKK